MSVVRRSGNTLKTKPEERFCVHFLSSLVPTPPAAASLAPASQVTRRGRIRISNTSDSTTHYLSKSLRSGNRIGSTSSIKDALELEWSTVSDGLQTLSISGVSCGSMALLRLTSSVPFSHRFQVMIRLGLNGTLIIHWRSTSEYLQLLSRVFLYPCPVFWVFAQ